MANNAIDITINAQDRASKKIKGLGKTFDTLHSKAEKAMGVISGIGAVAGAGLGAVAVAGVKMNSTLEQSEAKWTTLLKSSQKAEKQMAWMMDYAKQTPFDYEGIDATATALMGMGMSLEDVNKWLPTLGDASAVLGGGAETVEGLGRALGQMNAKGRVSAEEMQQLAERGVNAWQMLADGMGLPQAEVRKLSEEGKILAEDALPHIYEGMQKAFGGGTANLMQSTVGQAMEAGEQFSYLSGVLTSGAYNWFGANVLPMVNSAMESLISIFEGGLLSGFQKLWDSSTQAKIVLLTLAGVITGALIGAIFALAPAIVSAVVAFAPFLAIGMAVAGLATIIITYWEPIKAFFVNTFGSLYNSFVSFFQGIWTLIQPIVMMVVDFLVSKFQEFGAFWNEHWGMIKQAFVNIWTFISGFISTTLDVILAIFNFVFPAIKMVVLSVWEGIKNIINGALNFIMGIIQVFAGLFTGNWSKMWEGIKNMLFGAVEFIWGIIQTFFMGKIIGAIGKFASSGLKFITSFGSKAGSAISKFASNVWSKIKSMVSNVISSIKNWVSNMIGAVDNMVYKFLGKVTNFNADLGLLFAKGWEAVKRIVKSGIDGAINIVKNMFSTFKRAGKGLLSAFTDGIKNGINKAKNAVKNGLNQIRNFLPFSPAKTGPLSDLDKSGESFFPTFAQGMTKRASEAVRTASKGFERINGVMSQPMASMTDLESFKFGKQQQTLTLELRVSGEINTNGETTQVQSREISERTTGEIESIIDDLRQAIRKR